MSGKEKHEASLSTDTKTRFIYPATPTLSLVVGVAACNNRKSIISHVLHGANLPKNSNNNLAFHIPEKPRNPRNQFTMLDLASDGWE